jgi:hypothetical protein
VTIARAFVRGAVKNNERASRIGKQFARGV